MAMLRSWLWCLVWLALLHAVFAGPPGQGRHHTGYGSSSSKGRWGQSGHWNWQQSQPHYPHPTEVVVRVEDGKKSKKDKAKKKKKRSTSTSSSKSDSTDSRAKSKRRSKGKRKAPEGAHILGQKDIEELQQFRRQAEIQKIRNEVLASIPSGPGASSKSAPTAKPDEMPGDTTAEALSPKTKKVVLAQSRILGQDSVSKRLLTDEVVSWVDVKAQLLSAPRWLPAPFARAVRYVQALKVLAWDEYVLSHWLQITTGIPVATVSAGTLLLGYKWISEGNAAAKGVRKWIQDVAQTPIRRAKRLQIFSPDGRVRRALF